MNERIKQLAEQADIYSDKHAKSRDYVVLRDQYFAELIVQECVNQVDKSNYNSGDEWDKAMTCAANNIKEHFGVKE